MRDLGAHPRAPQLLAALLGSGGGVAPALLPAMAEPLAAALGVRNAGTLAQALVVWVKKEGNVMGCRSRRFPVLLVDVCAV